MILARRFYQFLALTGIAFVLGVLGIGLCLITMLVTYYTLISIC
jgi:hypothetical protein